MTTKRSCRASRSASRTVTGLAWTVPGLLPFGIWWTASTLAVLLAAVEAALIATVVLTALYAPKRISDRAFRMLPRSTPAQLRPPR
jgi:hypothetical protein